MDGLALGRRTAADASAGRDAVHLAGLVASDRDCPSAKGHDFQKASGARVALDVEEPQVTQRRDALLPVDSVAQAKADAEKRERSSAKERARDAKVDRAEAPGELRALRRRQVVLPVQGPAL